MSSNLKISKHSSANTALGYIREPQFQNGGSEPSRETQRARIETACLKRGWQVQFFEEQGEVSGSQTENRPAWNALQRRLTDQDVIAVVATDLSRLHRRGKPLTEILQMIESNNVTLVLTDTKVLTWSNAAPMLIAEMNRLVVESLNSRTKQS